MRKIIVKDDLGNVIEANFVLAFLCEETNKTYVAIDYQKQILLQKLREQLNKEHKIQRRQIWQSRFWAFMVGVGIGFAVH